MECPQPWQTVPIGPARRGLEMEHIAHVSTAEQYLAVRRPSGAYRRLPPRRRGLRIGD